MLRDCKRTVFDLVVWANQTAENIQIHIFFIEKIGRHLSHIDRELWKLTEKLKANRKNRAL